MKNPDLNKLSSLVEKFVNEREWDQFHSPKNLSMAMSVECSELVEIFQWMKEDESRGISSDEEVFSKVKDELADIFFYFLRFLHKTEIDIEEAMISKLEKNSVKYPAAVVKGLSKKYDQY